MQQTSRRLAEFLAAATPSVLSPQILNDAKRAVLDWLGSALAGSIEAPARMAQRVAAGFGASNEASVFSAGRASAAAAAFSNGVASHILELDDIHKTSTVHAAAPIIPAALAVAEREHADGRALLLAVTLGYEAALRIGEAVNPSHYRYWHPTGTAATFGAAVAAGSLLKLNAAQMLDALGSAGTQAAGLWEFNADGAMSKHLHPGKAALNGVMSADLARAGFTGASRILEGERGFFHAMSESFDATRVTDGLGDSWRISENCYKLHACCGHTHSAIDLALRFHADGLSAPDIQSIRIETYGPGFEIVRNLTPQTPYQAKFSIAYSVAAALLDGVVSLDQFTTARMEDPAIRDLIARTEVVVAADLTAKYPAAWPARLSITSDPLAAPSIPARVIAAQPLGTRAILSPVRSPRISSPRQNRCYQAEADYPRGNPENPVSTNTLEEKFTALVAPRFGAATAQRAILAVQSLETHSDMSRVFSDLAP